MPAVRYWSSEFERFQVKRLFCIDFHQHEFIYVVMHGSNCCTWRCPSHWFLPHPPHHHCHHIFAVIIISSSLQSFFHSFFLVFVKSVVEKLCPQIFSSQLFILFPHLFCVFILVFINLLCFHVYSYPWLSLIAHSYNIVEYNPGFCSI